VQESSVVSTVVRQHWGVHALSCNGRWELPSRLVGVSNRPPGW
jgi:hypothetical protein